MPSSTGERAERIEVALFDAAPRVRPPVRGGTWEEADPLTTFDLKRFNAVRGYQAQQGRETAATTTVAELQAELPNEPRIPSAPANDDAPEPAHDSRREEKMQNEPERPEPGPDGWEGFDLPEATRTELDRLLAADDWPGLARLAATGALLPLGLGPARTHLHRIFEKTGTQRQSQLVRLLLAYGTRPPCAVALDRAGIVGGTIRGTTWTNPATCHAAY
jgi:hypothetical protein